MNLATRKRALLAAGDVRGLIALNHSIYGDMQMVRRGIASAADVMGVLSDGTDLNQIWAEFAETLDAANAQRGALVDLLTFRTNRRSDTVLQSPTGTAEFERASEFGVPVGNRAEAATITLGYDFDWFDFGTAYTWQYLAEASAGQIESLHNGALAADSRLQYRTILNALFNNANRSHPKTDATIYALWNGDGMEVPEHNGDTFDPSHNHYLTTEGALTPADVELLTNQVLHHGYGESDGAKLVILCNREEGDLIAGWRAGVGGAAFDFISSDTSVPYLTTEQLVGSRPAGQLNGMAISGQYGQALIAPTSLIPAGYLACVAVGGPTPVIGMREHVKFPGLRLVRGSQPDYPIISSYYVHGIGAGVRQRGAAAVLQVTPSADYTPPTI